MLPTPTPTPTVVTPPTPLTPVPLPPRRSSSPLFNLLKRSTSSSHSHSTPASSSPSSSASPSPASCGNTIVMTSPSGHVTIPTLAQLEEMVTVTVSVNLDDDKPQQQQQQQQQQTRTMSMSEASFIDREWEEVDWERVKTLPMVCLIPPEEEEMGPVTLYPLLPPLPPSRNSTLSTTQSSASGPGRDGRPGSGNMGGTMTQGFILPPPVFSRSSSPSSGRGGGMRGGTTVIMHKKRSEVVASRARQLAKEMVEGPSPTPTPPRSSSLINEISSRANMPIPIDHTTIKTKDKLESAVSTRSESQVEVDNTKENESKGSVGYLTTVPDTKVVLEDRIPPLNVEVEVVKSEGPTDGPIGQSEVIDTVAIDSNTPNENSKDVPSLGQVGVSLDTDIQLQGSEVGNPSSAPTEETSPQVEATDLEVGVSDAYVSQETPSEPVPAARVGYRTPSPPTTSEPEARLEESAAPETPINPLPLALAPTVPSASTRRESIFHSLAANAHTTSTTTTTSILTPTFVPMETPIATPRKVSNDSTKSSWRDKKRRRTFSLTSLLAPKPKSESAPPVPPIPSVPGLPLSTPLPSLSTLPTSISVSASASASASTKTRTSTRSQTERVPGGPPTPSVTGSAPASGIGSTKVRRQKSLRQIFFSPSSDSPPPPLPTFPKSIQGPTSSDEAELSGVRPMEAVVVPMPIPMLEKRERERGGSSKSKSKSRSRQVSGKSTRTVRSISNQTSLDIAIYSEDVQSPSPLTSPITGPQIRRFNPSPITSSTPGAGTSRVGTRFSLSNLSGAFKRMASASHSHPQKEKEVPPVPLLPSSFTLSTRKKEIKGKENEIIIRRRLSKEHHKRCSSSSLIQSPIRTEERNKIEDDDQKEDNVGDEDSDDDNDDEEHTRTRTTSGFSAASLPSNGSPTCRNLTSVSPRTQRNPSASPALQEYMQSGPSNEVKMVNVQKGMHMRYQSVEATIFHGTVSSSSMDSSLNFQAQDQDHGHGHEVSLPSTSEEPALPLPLGRSQSSESAGTVGTMNRDESDESVVSRARQCAIGVEAESGSGSTSESSTRDSGGASLPDLETLTTPPIRSSGLSMDDIRRHTPITEPKTIMLEPAYPSSSSLPTLTTITAEADVYVDVDHQRHDESQSHRQRPSISSLIETTTGIDVPTAPTDRYPMDLGLYERDSNRPLPTSFSSTIPIPHVRMEMPVPTIKIKNRPFSPDAIRRLISLKKSHHSNGSGPKRPWADRTASEPMINTSVTVTSGTGTGTGTGTGSVGQENRQGGLEMSGQLKSLHFDDLGLDFDDFDWAQFGVGGGVGAAAGGGSVEGQIGTGTCAGTASQPGTGSRMGASSRPQQ